MSFVLFTHLNFGYESADGALFHDLTLQLSRGWTGIVGANGSGKSTLLKLVCGFLHPDSGSVRADGLRILCEQEVDIPPDNAEEFFDSNDSGTFRLRGTLRITPDMPGRWRTLSMGERKKLQIAAALFRQPDVLCIDEPTNHLDAGTRELLMRELKKFQGIGILVSHDRELLDSLCDQCLFLEHGKAVLRPGGVTFGTALQEAEIEQKIALRQNLKKELKRNKLELQRRREKEQKSRNADCKRKLDRYDHDGKGRIDAARVTGRDRTAGDLASWQSRIIERTEIQLAGIGTIKKAEYGLKIPYGCYSRKNVLLDTPAGILPLGSERILSVPSLMIGNHDRIALTGDNGGGKSTLLRYLLPNLKLSSDEYLYMPQELDNTVTENIRNALPSLSRKDYSKVMNVVASLGSRPERILDAETCSPGEWRKLFFGLGALREIKLIILDEPTNHLDLPSIECLETALADCGCALLLISHDRNFLNALCNRRWRIEARSDTENILRELH